DFKARLASMNSNRLMYNTTTKTYRTTNGCDKNTAHANMVSKSPTYMGLRVYRYTPRMTNEEAKLALMGFTVVLARRNATIPAMLMPWPAQTKTTAKSTRSG